MRLNLNVYKWIKEEKDKVDMTIDRHFLNPRFLDYSDYFIVSEKEAFERLYKLFVRFVKEQGYTYDNEDVPASNMFIKIKKSKK